MNRFFLSLISFLVCCISMIAQQRSESEAIQIAQEFFGKKETKRTPRLSIVGKQNVATQIHRSISAFQKDPDTNTSFYIVNDEANNRFVIVSADERFFKILGYSDNGIFNAEVAPPALLELLDGYNRQYSYLLTFEPNAPKVEMRDTHFPVISPIIQSKWGQGTPYNDLCPYSILGGKNYPLAELI